VLGWHRICGKRKLDPWCNNATVGNNATHGRPLGHWPSGRAPFAPAMGFAAVVDGSPTGLPDVPLRLLQQGLVNTGPSGEPISVILGTNHDEFALFIEQLPVAMPQLHLPVSSADMAAVVQHLVLAHDHWNSSTAASILAAYPEEAYPNQGTRLIALGTDLCFRCGTRAAARALSLAGNPTWLYSFEYRFDGYKDPASGACQAGSMRGCGVYHGAEVLFVWDHLSTSAITHPSDQAMADLMSQLWINFATSGRPGSAGSLLDWPQYHPASDMHLRFANITQISLGLANVTCSFWDSLPREGSYVHREDYSNVLLL